MILIAPLTGTTEVTGLLVRPLATERVNRPFGVTRQEQQATISWFASNT